jgi:ADP-ribose pyrophosphatase YjhB (NUDIX family)
VTRLRADGLRFRVRAAGVAIRDGRVLVHRMVEPNEWTNSALPGGGVEAHETSADAVVREFREEIGADVRTGRLLWCNENFFTHGGERWHEIGFYWEVLLPPDFAHFGDESFLGWDDVQGARVASRWHWCPLERLDEIDLQPSFLVEGLRNPPRTTRFLVHRDA